MSECKWAETEKCHAVGLINESYGVLFSKFKGATFGAKGKEAEWERIAASLNSSGFAQAPRSAKQLKTMYKNLKFKVKSKVDLRKQTGGGPPPVFAQAEDMVLMSLQDKPQLRGISGGMETGFPKVLGVIDCTHVKIQAPTHAEEEYVNRKGFHSLNVQMICDAKFRITNVVARWPGSVHDARIFRESDISEVIERGAAVGHLLGDSGYPCRPYLMTPYLHTQTRAQERFNNSLCRTRVLIEQTFGVLKRRFPCLAYGLRVCPDRAVKIVMSCAILHNIGLDRHDMFTPLLDDVVMPDNQVFVGQGTGSHIRDHIAITFFN